MKTRFFAISAMAVLGLAACNKEMEEVQLSDDAVIIKATAVAPGKIETKVAYTDKYSPDNDIVDITAAWEAGDSFNALEINDEQVTVVKFTTKESGKKVSFSSSGAKPANEDTKWIAIMGDIQVKDGNIICSYAGQDGTLENIGKYAYTSVTAEGAEPVFNFSKGTSYTYLMRLIMPAGIKYVEYNTGVTNEGGWVMNQAGKVRGTISSTEKAAAMMMTLKAETTAKQIVYLAIPAMNYGVDDENKDATRGSGLIVTIMSANQKLSQGKAYSKDLRASGACAGTLDMSGLSLIPRPLQSEAINLGSVSYDGVTYKLGSWAPYNLGGDIQDNDTAIKGSLFAWGETEPRSSFTKDSYKWYSGGTYTSQIGFKFINAAEGVSPFISFSAAGGGTSSPKTGTYYEIGGTRYDAARVKWGSEWRIPGNEVCGNTLKNGKYRLSDDIDKDNKVETAVYEKGAYTNSLKYTCSTMRAYVVKANGAELALYFAPFTNSGSLNTTGANGRYWTSTSDYGTTKTDGSFNGYWNRSVQMRLDSDEIYMNNMSYQWDGLCIRPVLND